MKPIVLVLVLTALVAGCSDGPQSDDGADSHKPDVRTVEIRGNLFNPSTVSMTQGDSVLFQNRDSVIHRIELDSGERQTGTIAPGKDASFALPTPGRHPYHCAIHPAMKGTIVVAEA
jgi:plastocyanin